MQPEPAATPSQGGHHRTHSLPPRPFPFNLASARFYTPQTMSLQGSQRPLLPGPLLLISSDYKDFDPDQLCRYQEEGYRVHYRQNADLKWFQEMADDIEANEPYAIIAFGPPALHALKFSLSPISRLIATIAYYPPAYIPFPAPTTRVSILIHAVPPLPPSLGPGVVMRTYADDEEDEDGHRCNVGIGFAEMARGSGVYRSVEAQVALTRDLDLLRCAMSTAGVGGIIGCGGCRHLQIEDVWEEFVQGIFGAAGAWADDRGVDVRFGFPLGWWGRGNEAGKYTGPNLLEPIRASVSGTGWKIKLLHRTIGVNRIVDEIVVKFRHVRRMHWILPGLEPTDRKITLGMTLSGGLHGGKVTSIRIYWDKGEAWEQLEPVENHPVAIVDATNKPD